jgi:hypothetical protein
MDASLSARFQLLPSRARRLPPAVSRSTRLDEMDLDPHRRGQAEVNDVDNATQKDMSHGFARQR